MPFNSQVLVSPFGALVVGRHCELGQAGRLGRTPFGAAATMLHAAHSSVSLDSRVPCRGIKDCQFSVDAFKRRGYRCESAAEIGRDRAQRKKPSKGGVSEPKPPHIAVNSDPRRREDVESSVPRAVAVLATGRSDIVGRWNAEVERVVH